MDGWMNGEDNGDDRKKIIGYKGWRTMERKTRYMIDSLRGKATKKGRTNSNKPGTCC